jgi:hypothetical protein
LQFLFLARITFSLTGVRAARVNVQALTIFGAVERRFGHCSCSAHRWSVLEEFVSVRVKRHSDTRWSSGAAAVNAISRQLEKVMAAFEQLRDTAAETLGTREDAAVIINGNEKLEFAALLLLWSGALCSTDRIQKCLQAKKQLFIKH